MVGKLKRFAEAGGFKVPKRRWVLVGEGIDSVDGKGVEVIRGLKLLDVLGEGKDSGAEWKEVLGERLFGRFSEADEDEEDSETDEGMFSLEGAIAGKV